MVDGGPIGTRIRPVRPPARDPARERRARDAALRGLAEALLIAAVSPVLPGLAHLRTGRARLGAALLAVQAAALAAAAWTVRQSASDGRAPLPSLAARTAWPIVLTAGCIVLAALWAALIVHSYTVLAPDGLPPLWRLAGGTTVSVLCLLVVVPPLTAARTLASCPVREYAPSSRNGGGFNILGNGCTSGHIRSHALDSHATFAWFSASIM